MELTDSTRKANFWGRVRNFMSVIKSDVEDTSTFIDLIYSLYPYGMTVNGVSVMERNEEIFYRWFEGRETVLKFVLDREQKMALSLGFINTFMGQEIWIEINGQKIDHIKNINENAVVRRHYDFQGHLDNKIVLRYKITNGSVKKYPLDSRDLAALFLELKVLYADIDVKKPQYSQRFDLSSIPYLGSPVQNAELNRKEYEEGRAVLKSLPSIVTLALTTYCNNKIPCVICDRNIRMSVSDSELDDIVINRTILLLKTAMYVLLHCGGEAMVSKYYDQIIESIQPPTRVTFATNAMLMTNKRADLMLKKDIMAGIVVSLDAATPEIYRIMRPGSKFETVIGNTAYYIAKAKELGRVHSNVTLNMTICEANICDVPKLVDLAVKIGAWGVDFNHLNSGLNHTAMTVAGWKWNYIEQADFKDKNQHDRLILEAYRKAKEKGVNFSFVGKPFIGLEASEYQGIIRDMTCQVAFQESQGVDHWHSPHHKKLGAHIPSCFKPWQEIVIQPDGAVRLCYFHDEQFWILGHLSKSDFMDIWNSDPMVAARRQFLAHGVARSCTESQPCLHRGRE